MDSRDSFIGIVQEHAGLIYKVAKLYTNSREDEEDLYQEIVYQLWKSFPSFRQEAKLSTWMYRIALNTAIAHLTATKRKGIHLPIEEALLNPRDHTDKEVEEQTKALYAMIKQLDTIEKGIVLLYLEGKSYEEMAAITGFTATNVGTRLSRIKQKIRAQIKNQS